MTKILVAADEYQYFVVFAIHEGYRYYCMPSFSKIVWYSFDSDSFFEHPKIKYEDRKKIKFKEYRIDDLPKSLIGWQKDFYEEVRLSLNEQIIGPFSDKKIKEQELEQHRKKIEQEKLMLQMELPKKQ